MALLRHVQHGRLGLRGFGRLPSVGSWNPPSTDQGSGIRQSHGIPEAFWEPCSGARRTASAAIPDFRIRAVCWCNALSLHCVCAVFRRRTSVPLCSAGFSCSCVRQAVRDKSVVGAHAGTSRGSWRCAGVCRTAGVAHLQEIRTAYALQFVALFVIRERARMGLGC
jgi:hypothetical protein